MDLIHLEDKAVCADKAGVGRVGDIGPVRCIQLTVERCIHQNKGGFIVVDIRARSDDALALHGIHRLAVGKRYRIWHFALGHVDGDRSDSRAVQF